MDFVRVEVERRRMTVGQWISRTIMGMIGLVLFLLSVIMIVTIVGILPGFGLGVISLFLLSGAYVGGEHLKCPRCGFKKNFVMHGKHNVTCRKCKQNIAIDWKKPRP